MAINTATIECPGCEGMFSIINIVFQKDPLLPDVVLCDHCLRKSDIDFDNSTVVKSVSEELHDALTPEHP